MEVLLSRIIVPPHFSPVQSTFPVHPRFRCCGAGEQIRGSAPAPRFHNPIQPQQRRSWVGGYFYSLGAQCEPGTPLSRIMN